MNYDKLNEQIAEIIDERASLRIERDSLLLVLRELVEDHEVTWTSINKAKALLTNLGIERNS